MSIWCSDKVVGWEGRKRHGGEVRSYATGWSNHYPTTNGKVERRALIDTAYMPAWCVPGHADNMGDPEIGPWLRLSVESHEHDYHKPDRVVGEATATVVLDEVAVMALRDLLNGWLDHPKVRP